jgi:hypothetical protein
MNAFTKILAIKMGVALAIAFCASNSEAQIFLVNSSFEDASEFFPASPTYPSGLSGVNQGWALHGSVGQAELTAGQHGLLEQNTPGNNWNPDVAYQIVSGVTPGVEYEFDVSYMTDTGFSGTFHPNVALEIGFLDSSLTEIGTVEDPTPNDASFSYAIPSQNTWYRGSVFGTAPVGASYGMVFVLFMDNGQTTTENVYFDNASLSIVPEPCGFALIGLGVAILISARFNFGSLGGTCL